MHVKYIVKFFNDFIAKREINKQNGFIEGISSLYEQYTQLDGLLVPETPCPVPRAFFV